MTPSEARVLAQILEFVTRLRPHTPVQETRILRHGARDLVHAVPRVVRGVVHSQMGCLKIPRVG